MTYALSRILPAFVGLAVAASLLTSALAHAQGAAATTYYFAEPPSAAELLQLLNPPTTRSYGAAAPAETRAVIFKNDGKDVPPAQVPPAPTSSAQVPAVPAPVQPVVAVAMNIPFANNSADLSTAALDFARQIGVAMTMDKSFSVTLGGHANRTGTDARNDALSQARAETVRDFVARQYGIDPARIVAVGYGSRNPMSGVAPQDGRNRRVDLTRR